MQNDEAREDSQEDDGIDLNEGRYMDVSCGAFNSNVLNICSYKGMSIK